MTQGTFSYALLQYHHSQILGEVINVGLIAYFPDQNQLKFIFPEKLIRLKFAYPDLQEKTIKSYLKYFDSKVVDLNLRPDFFADYDLNKSFPEFLHSEFLQADSSALQFGLVKKSVLYSNNHKVILDQLYNLYFSVFNQQEINIKRIDESSLLIKYKKLFAVLLSKYKIQTDQKTFSVDYKLEPILGTQFNFELAWKGNSELHLVKPISLNLSKPESITNKAYRYYGQFSDLENLAHLKEIKFDLLLSKPTTKSLFSSYDNALRILRKPKFVNLIEAQDLDEYAKLTLDSINLSN